MTMNILVLHNLENLERARRSSAEYIFCFERYAPDNNFLYHRIVNPITPAIRQTDWDAVILESTALGICTFRPREKFYEEKRKWSFLADSDAVKIVFPQDDANQSGLMDDWFDEMGGVGLFTVRPEFSSLLYPKTTRHSDVRGVLSGYVDDTSLSQLRSFSKPFAERSCLVGQRVTMYPFRGGRHARIKGEAAEMVKAAAQARGLPVDISTDPQDVLYGDDWYSFLGNCKYVVGAEGGLSIWDPYGDICDRIDAYLADHPGASFEEVEAACFPGEDGKHVFPGFTPRILEAAMCGCGQILVEGEYLGVLKPYEHYIPLKKDGSNLDEVFEIIKDEEAAQRRIDATYRILVENPRFRYSHLVNTVFDYIREKRPARRLGMAPEAFHRMRSLHVAQLTEAITEREREVGFVGETLVDRVARFMRAQTVEPLVRPGPAADEWLDLHETIARARATSRLQPTSGEPSEVAPDETVPEAEVLRGLTAEIHLLHQAARECVAMIDGMNIPCVGSATPDSPEIGHLRSLATMSASLNGAAARLDGQRSALAARQEQLRRDPVEIAKLLALPEEDRGRLAYFLSALTAEDPRDRGTARFLLSALDRSAPAGWLGRLIWRLGRH
ncbi:hypothetical protein [Caenispirillum bisanense]|uniref:hypothetical protein n=1 Tax=Caenispirillum bisanense TaxID=414052 RepID=UPI0031CDB12E